MPPTARPPHVALLVAITAAGPLALNVFVPSMPGLVRVFDTSYATVQLTLTLYLIGVSVGQLVYGPLSDRFGRRPVLLAGLGLYVAAGLACALATSIGMLIAARVVQALGGCAGMVLTRAIVRDVHGRDKSASVLAYITMAMAAAPAVAPAVGGLLDEWFGWRAGFVMLALYGAGVLLACLPGLRETHFDRQPLPGLAGMAAGYAELARSPVFLGYAISAAAATAAFFAFLAGAPFLVIERLGRPPSEYGVLFLLLSLGYMAGNFASARLIQRIGTERMVVAGTALALAGVGGALALGLAGVFTPLALFAPMVVTTFGHGISMPGAVAAAISTNPRITGTASGLLGFLQMVLSAAATPLVGALPNHDQVPMVLVMLAITLIGLGGYVLATRAQRPVPAPAPAPAPASAPAPEPVPPA